MPSSLILLPGTLIRDEHREKKTGILPPFPCQPPYKPKGFKIILVLLSTTKSMG